MILLTNAALEDTPVAIDEKLIVSVFKGKVKNAEDEEKEVTLIFVPPHGTWQVNESVEEVVELINNRV